MIEKRGLIACDGRAMKSEIKSTGAAYGASTFELQTGRDERASLLRDFGYETLARMEHAAAAARRVRGRGDRLRRRDAGEPLAERRGAAVAGDFHEGGLAEAIDKPALVGDVIDEWLNAVGAAERFAMASTGPTPNICGRRAYG